MVRSPTFQPHSRQQPDPIRIAALSAAIAFNAATFALLMRPPEFTPQIVSVDTTPPIQFITPEVKKVEVKPLPLPVKPHVEKPTPVTPQVVHKETMVISEKTTPMSTEVDTTPVDTDKHVIETVATGPVEEALTALAAPPPTYPRGPLTEGITGTVQLELLVGVDGHVLEVRVVHSSGNRQLDAAAREQVLRNWRFQPAQRNGIAVQSLGRVPIVFTLDGR